MLLTSSPDFVATSLFQFLPTPELARAAAVCRTWRQAVQELCDVDANTTPARALAARYWSRLEERTRREELRLEDAPRWRPAFREQAGVQQQQQQQVEEAEAADGDPPQPRPPALVPCLLEAARHADKGLGLAPPARLGTPELLEQVACCCGLARAEALRALRALRSDTRAAPAADRGGIRPDSSVRLPGPGFWGSLLLALLAAPGAQGLNRLVEWLWAQSEHSASGAAPLARRDVTEFLAATAVLLRLQEWRGALPEAAAAAHDAIVSEVQQQQVGPGARGCSLRAPVRYPAGQPALAVLCTTPLSHNFPSHPGVAFLLRPPTCLLPGTGCAQGQPCGQGRAPVAAAAHPAAQLARAAAGGQGADHGAAGPARGAAQAAGCPG